MLARKGATFLGTTTKYKLGSYCQIRKGSTKNKLLHVEDAVQLIKSGDTVTISGFVTQNSPEEILAELGRRYKETKTPCNLTLVVGAAPGDAKTKGINHLAQPGMLKRVVGAHYALCPQLASICQSNKVEAYSLPLGSISRMLRSAATKAPGHITTVGYGTLTDPKFGGGKMNSFTKEDLVEEIEVLGKKYLIYKAIPIDVAIIRGTTADPFGNVTMEHESLYADNLVQAMAARANGGKVLVQVSRMAAENSLEPRKVRIPGTMVDAVVVADRANHWMSYLTDYNPGFSSEVKVPVMLEMDMDERKIVARRAMLEVAPNQVVNLGIGLADGVAVVAEEEKVRSFFTLTTEPGVHGGLGATGFDFGPAINYDALIDMNQQFDFYNGGGLDVCFLGMLQVNRGGDVNVTRVGTTVKGPGGFIDISQSTKRVNLLGTFTAGGLEVAVEDGRLRIVQEGRVRKFVRELPEVSFSGANALARGQQVRYMTERCVFRLTADGLELVEVAAGVDVQTQILDLMDFAPVVRRPPRLMDPRIFARGRMGLLESTFQPPMARRVWHCPATRTVYINLCGVSVTSSDRAAEMLGAVEAFYDARPDLRAEPVLACYEGFDCAEHLADAYATRVASLQSRFYGPVRRLASEAGLTRRRLAARLGIEIRESFSREEAGAMLRCMGHPLDAPALEALCQRFQLPGAPMGTVAGRHLVAMTEAIQDGW